MIGNPMTAAQWAEALGITDGNEVLRILMPFHERPIELRACGHVAALKSSMLAALEGLGIVDGKVTVVSKESVLASAGLPNIRSSLCLGLYAGIDHASEALLNDMFRKPLHPQFRHNTGLQNLQDVIYGAQWLELQRRMLPVGGKILHNFFSCIYHQIGFLAMARGDLAAKIAPFTSCMADGHLPVGLADDNNLLLLVA